MWRLISIMMVVYVAFMAGGAWVSVGTMIDDANNGQTSAIEYDCMTDTECENKYGGRY